jgi:methylthioribose-1-phosphate isomerase
MVLQAIKYEKGRLSLLDQRALPHEFTYLPVTSVADAWKHIKVVSESGTRSGALVGSVASSKL